MAVGAAASAQTAVVVRPDALNGWSPLTRNTGVYSFAQGPAGNAYGSGSFQMFTGTGQPNSGMAWAATSQFDGRRVSTLTSLAYSTHVTSTSQSFAPYLVMSINTDGAGPLTAADPVLVFEPYSNGTVATGQWQRWNALSGRWFATNGTWNGSGWVPGGREYHTLAEWTAILNATTSATIESIPNPPTGGTYGVPQGGLNLAVGNDANFGPWNNFVGAADGLQIGFSGQPTVLFDFQPVPEPSTVLLTAAVGLAAWGRARRVRRCSGHGQQSGGEPPIRTTHTSA